MQEFVFVVGKVAAVRPSGVGAGSPAGFPLDVCSKVAVTPPRGWSRVNQDLKGVVALELVVARDHTVDGENRACISLQPSIHGVSCPSPVPL